MSAPYPWQTEVWQRLLASRARPAQTLLLAGPAGVGKRVLARAWAKILLCEAPTAAQAACGACAACHWFEADTHPDYRFITRLEKEDKSSGKTRLAANIEVDQAREAVDFVQLSTHRAGHRVLVIDPADALNPASANALLKALEEPPAGTVFILVADHARQLLPTLRSRAQRIDFGLPPRALAVEWLAAQDCAEPATRLALAGGAPLKALAWDTTQAALRSAVLAALAVPTRLSPVAQADAWKDLPASVWHAIAYTWLADLIAASQGARARFNPDFADALALLGPRVMPGAALKLARVQADVGRHLAHPLNRALQLEAWLVQYQNVFTPRLSA